MKKLLLVTLLALGATQAMASNAVRLTPSQAAYQKMFGQCLQTGKTSAQCYALLHAAISPTPQASINGLPSEQCFKTADGITICTE